MKDWDAIHAYYSKRLDNSLTEEDKRLFVEACEHNIIGATEYDFKYSVSFKACLYNLASFYEEEGYERLARKYFALYRKVEEMS